jgi:hypothetical protein
VNSINVLVISVSKDGAGASLAMEMVQYFVVSLERKFN